MKRRGFTLIEVIVTIIIALIVLTMVGLSLYLSARSTTSTRVSIVKKEQIMIVYAGMRQQMLNIAKTKNKNYSVEGEEGRLPREDEIRFITSSLSKSVGVGEASYRVEQEQGGEGRKYLAYREFPIPYKEEYEEGKWIEKSSLIEGLELEYYSEGQWVKEWKKEPLPERIKVTLWYRSGDKDESFTFYVTPGLSSTFVKGQQGYSDPLIYKE